MQQVNGENENYLKHSHISIIINITVYSLNNTGASLRRELNKNENENLCKSQFQEKVIYFPLILGHSR